MGIFSRTRDIVAANFADLLDKAEDPSKMIRMIILEMEETLVEVRASAARTIADQKEMRRHIAKLEQLQANWTEKAELALSKDREDLAKAALLERQKATDMAEQLKAEVQVLDDALRASEEDIAKLQGRLREARTKQSNIQTRIETANNRFRLRDMYAGRRRMGGVQPLPPTWNAAPTRPRAAPRRWAWASARAGGGDRRAAPERRVDEELAAMKRRLQSREG